MAFPGNDWLLLRDEPGMRAGEPTEDEGGACRSCGGQGGVEAANGGCWDCDPSVPLEDTPVRASFHIAPPVGRGIPGVLTWAAGSAP